LSRGQAASAGLYFKIDQGWHVYWKNAGDAGEPPHIKWTLPDGITAGPLQFPVPKRLPLGPLMDFGYEDEVLFPFTVTAASTAKPGPAVLHAKVDWLVCQASCIPGKAELEVSRDVLDHPGKAAVVPSDADLFKRLSGRLPKPLPATVKASFQPTKEGFRLSIATGQKESEAAFFPADQDIIDNPAPQKITSSPKGLILDLKKDANLTANPAELRGLIELSGGRAFEFAAAPGRSRLTANSRSNPAHTRFRCANANAHSARTCFTRLSFTRLVNRSSDIGPVQPLFRIRASPRHRPCLPGRPAPESDAVRLPGPVPQGPVSGQLWQ
jgi:thiol:disulfide interchange protein DsbD